MEAIHNRIVKWASRIYFEIDSRGSTGIEFQIFDGLLMIQRYGSDGFKYLLPFSRFICTSAPYELQTLNTKTIKVNNQLETDYHHRRLNDGYIPNADMPRTLADICSHFLTSNDRRINFSLCIP